MGSKTKIIIISTIFTLAVAGAFVFVRTAGAASCGDEVLKFFPEGQIISVIGLIKSTSGTSSGITSSCSFSLDVSASGIATAKVSKFASPAQAKASFQANYHGSDMNIGDGSSFRSGSDSAVLKGQYIFAVSWYCFCTEKIYLSEDQARLLLSYAISQVKDSSTPPGTIPPDQRDLIKCGALTTKYFQPEKLETILNEKILGAQISHSAKFTNLTTEHCRFQMGKSVNTKVWQYASDQLAADAYKSNLSSSAKKIDIGDEADISKTAGAARKANFRFQVDKCCGTSALNDEEVTELLKLAVNAVGSDDDIEPPPTGNKPQITSFSPGTISAGTKQSYNANTGLVKYASTAVAVTIIGQDLHGAVLTSDNVGTDGKPGIEFKNIESNKSGTKVQGYLISHPTAKDGKTAITLTNKGGQSTTFNLKITITGTQYLKRVFSKERIKFFGERIETMPDQSILDLEKEIRTALGAINKPTYKKLGIVAHVYEISFWETTAETKYCGNNETRGFSADGCASWNDNIIYVSESSKPKRVLLHEAAHKLHFYYLGFYKLKPEPNSFQTEWKRQVNNLSTCVYLPLKLGASITWSDGTEISRCGFAWPYGAYESKKGDVYEDVATFAEQSAFSPINEGDTNDPRYVNKMNLIKKYGF